MKHNIQLLGSWVLVMLCAIPLVQYTHPVLNEADPLALNADGSFYIEVTNLGIKSLSRDENVFRTSKGTVFTGIFAHNAGQLILPADPRRETGKTFLARVDIQKGADPTVYLIEARP